MKKLKIFAYYNLSKAEKKFHWKPKVRPEKGIKNLINWIKENEDLFSDPEDEK